MYLEMGASVDIDGSDIGSVSASMVTQLLPVVESHKFVNFEGSNATFEDLRKIGVNFMTFPRYYVKSLPWREYEI